MGWLFWWWYRTRGATQPFIPPQRVLKLSDFDRTGLTLAVLALIRAAGNSTPYLAVIGLAVITILAVAGGLIALDQRNAARTGARVSQAQRDASLSEIATASDALDGVALALASVRWAETREGYDALAKALRFPSVSPSRWGVMRARSTPWRTHQTGDCWLAAT